MNNEMVGKYLFELRQEKNLTQSELASLCNVTFQAVSQWETGKSLPDIDSLKNLSKIYDITINEILDGKRKVQAEPEIEEAPKESNFEIKSQINSNIIVSIALAIITFILIIAGLIGRSIQLMIFPAFIITLYHVLYYYINKDIYYASKKYISLNNALTIISGIFLVLSVIIFMIGISNGGLNAFGALQPFIYFGMTLNFNRLGKFLKEDKPR